MRWFNDITNSMAHEFLQTLGDGEGQGSLPGLQCWTGLASPRGCKELDVTEGLNNKLEYS